MKFSCDKNSLLTAVNKVIKGVTPRTTLPILQGILIKAYENNIKMYSTDLEIGIECTLEANIESWGNIVVSAKVFSELIRKFPEDIVYFESDDNNIINIKCGASNFTISGSNSEEFPEITEIIKEKSLVIKANILKDMLRETSFCTAQEQTRPILTGILFEINKNQINMVALDGYRMALTKYFSEDIVLNNTEKNDFNIVIPGTTVDELTKIIDDDEEYINIFFTNNQVLFEMDNTKLISRLLEGNYMNYNAVLPKDFKTIVKVNKQMLIGGIERASLLASGKNNLIKFTINDNELIISSNSDIGKMFEKLQIELEGMLLEIAFNSRYLLEALKVIDEEEINLCFINNINPMIITPVGNDNYLYMILPVKLNN
ncbi:MAG: DNA polymerase III subunit beta [Thermoanaerobacteraceae bacterium]|nr:DNA polymerase III subunit beta [Thermoanaerobacteraceae bacterium]